MIVKGVNEGTTNEIEIYSGNTETFSGYENYNELNQLFLSLGISSCLL